MAAERIQRRKQMKGESFEFYWYSKLQLIRSLNPTLPETDIMTNLINGLNPVLNNKVLERVLLSPCESLEELFNLVKALNDVNTFVSTSEPTQKVKGKEKIEANNAVEETNNSLDLAYLAKAVNDLKSTLVNDIRSRRYCPTPENEDKAGIKYRRKKENIKCFSCGNMGHFANECQNEEQDQETSE